MAIGAAKPTGGMIDEELIVAHAFGPFRWRVDMEAARGRTGVKIVLDPRQ